VAGFLYLTTTGWRTGRPHRIEIWYLELDGRYYLISELREQAHWVQNLQREASAVAELGEEPFAVRGRVVLAEQEPELSRRVSAAFDDRYGWSDGLIVELERAEPRRLPSSTARC
jgi:hypothetical protein